MSSITNSNTYQVVPGQYEKLSNNPGTGSTTRKVSFDETLRSPHHKKPKVEDSHKHNLNLLATVSVEGLPRNQVDENILQYKTYFTHQLPNDSCNSNQPFPIKKAGNDAQVEMRNDSLSIKGLKQKLKNAELDITNLRTRVKDQEAQINESRGAIIKQQLEIESLKKNVNGMVQNVNKIAAYVLKQPIEKILKYDNSDDSSD
jgi:uncharacterized coiled-coil protein SlyX